MSAGTHFPNDASLPCLLRFLSSQKEATCDHNRGANAATSMSSHIPSDSSKERITCRGHLVDPKLAQVVYMIEEITECAHPLSLATAEVMKDLYELGRLSRSYTCFLAAP